MIICGTGHRPSKLGNSYSPVHPIQVNIKAKLKEVLTRAKTKHPDLQIISGGALGFDQWIAEVAIDLDIPVRFFLPFKGYDLRWPDISKNTYASLFEKAAEVKYVSEGRYSPAKLHARNRAMVDASDCAIALWDSKPGGTANCIEYIKKTKKPYLHITPYALEEAWHFPKEVK